MSRSASAFLFLVLINIFVSEADAWQCPSGFAFVAGEGDFGLVCEAAEGAVEELGMCGIKQNKPFRAFVVAELPEECPPNALGFYDASTDRVVVATYDTCVEITESDKRFGVPMSKPLYRSLLVHEFVHALVEQNAKVNRPGHEYIAYAIQLKSMESELRAQIKRNYPHPVPITENELNDNYFYLSPPDFAVKAYNHFATPGNGCGFIRDLIQGRRRLPSGMR